MTLWFKEHFNFQEWMLNLGEVFPFWGLLQGSAHAILVTGTCVPTKQFLDISSHSCSLVLVTSSQQMWYYCNLRIDVICIDCPYEGCIYISQTTSGNKIVNDVRRSCLGALVT